MERDDIWLYADRVCKDKKCHVSKQSYCRFLNLSFKTVDIYFFMLNSLFKTVNRKVVNLDRIMDQFSLLSHKMH